MLNMFDVLGPAGWSHQAPLIMKTKAGKGDAEASLLNHSSSLATRLITELGPLAPKQK
jgi:hypothetical protein